MPHPPSLPAHRVWGMGVKLWLLCVLRKCRTLTTALVFLCLWICLITVINTVSDGGRPTVAISDARNTFLRPGDLSRSAASVLRLSPTNKEWERDSLSLGRNDARSGPRNELRFPPPGGEARWVPGPDARDQDTSAVLENGIIGGRRIQGIKAGEMEGLESLSARSERDEQDGEPSVAAAAGVSTPAQIDTHDTSEMAIAGTARELSQDLGDLRSNWTPKMGQNPPELNIPGQGLKAARQESQQDRFVSSRARNSFLSSLTEPRKPGSEGEETGTGSGTYGLLGRGKSIGKRLSPAGAELHNRQTALYDRGSDQAINTLFNSDEPSTTRENEAGERTRKSQTRFTASSNQYPTSPLANLDKTSRTQTLKDQGRKSNLERGIAMQMDVPKRNTGFSPTATIDQIGEPAARQMWLGVKYPAQTYSFPGVEKDKSNGEGERSALSLSSHAKARNESTSAVGVSTPRKSSDIGDQQGRAINPAFIKPPVSGALDWLSASGPSNSLLSGPGREVQQADTSGHKRLKNDGFDLYSYNVTASDWLSLSREIPDTRPPGCPAAAAYNQTGQLRASVVICFHNEALSVLLRTVHSVLGRTPGPLLDRLILVDDFSDTDDLQSELDDRLRDLDPRILLTRTSKREGLVRSRLIGSNLATSDVLVFLDAHCECNTDWLEPLLAQIAQGHDQVVCPYIDTIRAETFHYRQSPADLQGGFNWRLEFGWRAATDADRVETDPIRTPVISGGLFAVRRDYFNLLGTYDPELDIWGGENFELSFKTWMCGGSMTILPCSRVGHVFRNSLPYTFSDDKEMTVLRNLARIAHVWMDGYAHTFLSAVDFPVDLDIGDTSLRTQLRQDLGCRDFQWYLDHVFPQMEVISPEVAFHGLVKNQGSLLCLDVMEDMSGFFLGLSACRGDKNQTVTLTSKGQLKQGEACLVPAPNKRLTPSTCNNNFTWVHQNGTLRLDGSDLCMTSVDSEIVHLLACDVTVPGPYSPSVDSGTMSDVMDAFESLQACHTFQQWTFDYSFSWKRRRRKRNKRA